MLAGAPMMPRNADHKAIARMARAATAKTATITEVSMRQPNHWIVTSPGRSASHATPNASTPTRARKTTIRIIGSRSSWRGFAERPQRIAFELAACRQCRVARLRALDPIVPGGARLGRQLFHFRDGARNITAFGV